MGTCAHPPAPLASLAADLKLQGATGAGTAPEPPARYQAHPGSLVGLRARAASGYALRPLERAAAARRGTSSQQRVSCGLQIRRCGGVWSPPTAPAASAEELASSGAPAALLGGLCDCLWNDRPPRRERPSPQGAAAPWPAAATASPRVCNMLQLTCLPRAPFHHARRVAAAAAAGGSGPGGGHADGGAAAAPPPAPAFVRPEGASNIVPIRELNEFRRGVGLCIYRRDGLVFAARRLDDPHGSWQMPQVGGLQGLPCCRAAARCRWVGDG